MDDQQKPRDLNAEAIAEIEGDPAERRAAEDASRKLADAFYNTFTSESGQAVLQYLRAAYRDQLAFDPANPYQTAFNEGQRHIVLTIDEFIQQVAEGEI